MADEVEKSSSSTGGLTSSVEPLTKENNSPESVDLCVDLPPSQETSTISNVSASETSTEPLSANDVAKTDDTLPTTSVSVEEEQITSVEPLELERVGGAKKMVLFGTDPLSPKDESEVPGPSGPNPRLTSAATRWSVAAAGLHHKGPPPPPSGRSGAHHRSFAVLGKTMVGFGRNGKARGSAAQKEVVPDLRTVDSTLVYKVLRPFFWSMRVAGIFFIRRLGGLDAVSSSTGCCSRRFRGCLRRMPAKSETFSCFVCVLLGLNVIRSFSAFDSGSGFNQTFSFKLTWMALWFEGFSRTLLSVIFWHRRKGGFQEFLINLDTIFFTDGIVPYETALSKMMTVFLVVTSIILCITVALFSYGISSKNPDLHGVYDVALTPYKVDPDGPVALDVVVRVAVLIMFTWNVLVCLLFIGFFAIVCYLLYKEFEYLCRTFKLKITDDGRFTDDLERFRVTHQSRS